MSVRSSEPELIFQLEIPFRNTLQPLWAALLPGFLGLMLAASAAAQAVVQAPQTPPPGKFLYVAGSYEMAINPNTGGLRFIKNLGTAAATFVDPSNHFAYAPSYIAGPVIYIYRIDQASGSLLAVPGSPFPGDPSDVYASFFPDAKGEFLFSIGEDVNSDFFLSVFRFDRTTGAISETDRIPVTNETFLGWVISDVADKYVFLGESSGIACFSLNTTTGTLSEVTGSPFPSRSVTMLGLDKNFLYAMNNDDTLSGFKINEQTGALTEVSGSPLQNPLQQWLAIDRVNNFLYTSNTNFFSGNTTNVITTFRINTSSGTLLPLARSGQDILHEPEKVVADPSGRFVYVGDLKLEPSCVFDQCIGATNSFVVDAATGKLTVVTKQIPYPGDPYDGNFSLAVAR